VSWYNSERRHTSSLLIELDRHYTLGYVSSNTAKDGNWRKVELTVKRPSANRLVVRTRQGYFAPAKEVPARDQPSRDRAGAVR
jgi:hypothetical protein